MENTITQNEAIENIVETLREVDGMFLVKIYNMVCSDQLEYIGDSFYTTNED